MFYVIKGYFETEHSLCAADVIFEHAIRWSWLECVVFTDQDHLTVNDGMNTKWNDKIVVLKKTTLVVLKKTTLQLYFKTFIEKINSGNLNM